MSRGLGDVYKRQDVYRMHLSEKEERFIEIQFRKIMKREIRDIEKDIENIS